MKIRITNVHRWWKTTRQLGGCWGFSPVFVRPWFTTHQPRLSEYSSFL